MAGAGGQGEAQPSCRQVLPPPRIGRQPGDLGHKRRQIPIISQPDPANLTAGRRVRSPSPYRVPRYGP
jgi:hypothetical protein